jgi:hypothetical protein
MPNDTLPEWEDVLSFAARLQNLFPEAVLVGGPASALRVVHRFSGDADHVLGDLAQRFDGILAQLESVAGWKTARIKRPVQILGSLDGISTGIRQLIREEPLETTKIQFHGLSITVPTLEEILRIKGALILKRNAARDYIDFVALVEHLPEENLKKALAPFDTLYPQANGESALQQLQIQLSKPMPFDLGKMNLKEYKNLNSRWCDWTSIERACANVALTIFDHILEI